MISDDDRREVARRLRENADSGAPLLLLVTMLAFDCPIEGRTVTTQEAALRLADLIEPSEPKVRCVAEVKIDGERLEELVHDAAVELTGIDRDALLALADEMEYDADVENAAKCDPMLGSIARMQVKYANRIREALGEGA